MIFRLVILFAAAFTTIFAGVCLTEAQTTTAKASEAAPQPYYWSGDHLQSIRNGDEQSPAVAEALERLAELSSIAKNRGPYSVVDKTLVPPSGDKHDYLSFSRYWWPNPDTKDGLPYIRKDGIVNRPMVAKGDRVRLGEFCNDVEWCALASYLLDDAEAGKHANLLLTTWFLKPETRMTPSIEYGQGVLGKSHGRPVGILDVRNFLQLFDAVELLKAGKHISPEEVSSLQDWFKEYDQWLETSPMADGERQANNNHGTWFFAQEAAVAFFIGDKEKAKKILRHVQDVRIPAMIMPDGTQPKELERTLSMHYSYFQLEAFMHCARLGEQLDMDFYAYESASGSSLKGAFEYLLPYLVDKYDDWPYKQIKRLEPSDKMHAMLMLAADRWKDDRYLKALKNSTKREDHTYFAPLLFAE